MATQICALAGVLIHCGFPTSFSESSSRLRASISKRVSLFTNDHRARIFHSTLRHGEPSASENCPQKKEGGARRVINRGWISIPLKTSHRFIEILVQDPARFANLLSTRNEILSPCRSSHASFPGIFIAAALPQIGQPAPWAESTSN